MMDQCSEQPWADLAADPDLLGAGAWARDHLNPLPIQACLSSPCFSAGLAVLWDWAPQCRALGPTVGFASTTLATFPLLGLLLGEVPLLHC